MQAIESQTLILYHTDLRGQWPQAAARTFALQLPYLKRLAVSSGSAVERASVAGLALARHALTRLLGRAVEVGEIVLAAGRKPAFAGPQLAAGEAAQPRSARAGCGAQESVDFSISHSGPWVGCAALAHGRVGFDVELGTEARIADWVVREAVLKATGEGLRAAYDVRGLELTADEAHWRGQSWHLQRLDLFAGASAAVMSSTPLQGLVAQAVALEELFAP
jgi:phosphopantetheinyl transferase